MTTAARRPVVAGQFYPGEAAALTKQIEQCFLDARGPGELPTRRRSNSRSLIAAVVPHAGYEYSGAIAAHVYAQVARERPPESVLVLGVDHHGASEGPSISRRPWSTPLGPMAIDAALADALDRPPVRTDEAAHAYEHSIEVQLPFLEYVLPHPRFVPLEVPFGPLDYLRSVGEVVRAATRGRDVLLLASTDFSHYVPAETARRLDHLAIDAILARDAARLYETVAKHDISMCGIAPTTVLLSALSDRPLSTRLFRYGHSGEVVRMRDVVGYAAIALDAPPAAPAPVK